MDLDKVAESLLESDNFYKKQATEVISFEMLKQRHKEEIKEALSNTDLSDAIVRGFEWIRQDIIEVLSEEELEPFFDDLSKINHEHLVHPSDEVAKKLANNENVTLQELFGLTNQTLQKIYALGYQYFQKHNNERAIDIFSIVTTFNPFISDFWNALALCYQATKQWKLAIDAFTLACSTNDSSIAPLISRAECCLKVNLTEEAVEEMEIASKMIETNPALDKEWGAYLKDLRRSI